MSDDDHGQPMKSAYDIALERLEKQGVAPPCTAALSEETKQALAQVRARAEASLAELEILHRDRLQKAVEPVARAEEEKTYLDDRRRIEERRDREVAELRDGFSSDA